MKIRSPDSVPLDEGEPSRADSRTQGARSLASLSPGEVMLARCRAFSEGDFGFVYDGYHQEANFLGQFPDREAYLRYGREVLARQFRILACRVLRERVAGDEARVLFYQKVRYQGEHSESLERAHLLRSEGGWLYLGGEKLDRAAIAEPLESIGWEEFERAGEKVFY